jgi:hypothetical protein
LPSDDQDVYIAGRFQAAVHRGSVQISAEGLRPDGVVDQLHDVREIHPVSIDKCANRAHPISFDVR